MVYTRRCVGRISWQRNHETQQLGLLVVPVDWYLGRFRRRLGIRSARHQCRRRHYRQSDLLVGGCRVVAVDCFALQKEEIVTANLATASDGHQKEQLCLLWVELLFFLVVSELPPAHPPEIRCLRRPTCRGFILSSAASRLLLFVTLGQHLFCDRFHFSLPPCL